MCRWLDGQRGVPVRGARAEGSEKRWGRHTAAGSGNADDEWAEEMDCSFTHPRMSLGAAFPNADRRVVYEVCSTRERRRWGSGPSTREDATRKPQPNRTDEHQQQSLATLRGPDRMETGNLDSQCIAVLQMKEEDGRRRSPPRACVRFAVVPSRTGCERRAAGPCHGLRPASCCSAVDPGLESGRRRCFFLWSMQDDVIVTGSGTSVVQWRRGATLASQGST